MILDQVGFSLRNMWTRPARSGLTILGIVVGVAAVVALIAIGQGMQKSVEEQFRAIGYNTIIVTPGGGGGEGAGQSPMPGMAGRFSRFQGQMPTGADPTLRGEIGGQAATSMDRIKALPQVARAGVLRTETALVTSEGMQGQGLLRVTGLSLGITDDFPGYFPGFVVYEGRNFQVGDELVLVLGNQVAADLGAEAGSVVRVENKEFTVVGVLEPTRSAGVGVAFRNLDMALLVPIEALATLYGNPGRMSMGLIEVREGMDVEQASTVIRTTFTQLGTPVTTVSTRELSERIGAVLGNMQMALTAIAAVALIVGAIGVMNTMYTSVVERTRQIGVMKAVGAKDRQVLGLFLVESGLLGLIGGVLGCGLGVAMSSVVANVIGGSFGATGQFAAMGVAFSPSFDVQLVLGALVLSFVLGALAGALPALRGAKLRPVEALRYE